MIDINDDKLWNSWTSNEDVALLVDGKKINDIFTMIRKQVDYLRKHMQQIQNTLDIQELSLSKIPSISNDSNINSEDFDFLLDKVNSLQAAIMKLDNLNGKIDKFEKDNTYRHDQIAVRFDDISKKLIMHDMYADKISQVEKKFNEKIIELTNDFNQKLLSSNKIHENNKNNLENEIIALKNVCDINGLKMKTIETTLMQNGESINELRDNLDYFPIKYLDSIRNDVIELFKDKADKSDLYKKADLHSIHTKANLSDIDKLATDLEEINRRISMQSKELHENINGMDSKLDRRMQSIAQWCLKSLRKELKSNSGSNESNNEGTDIGRLRCLVCDQVTPQHHRANSSVHAPSLKNVLKPMHNTNTTAMHSPSGTNVVNEIDPEVRGRNRRKAQSPPATANQSGPIITRARSTSPIMETTATTADIRIAKSISMPKLNHPPQKNHLNSYNSSGVPYPLNPLLNTTNANATTTLGVTSNSHSKLVKLGAEQIHFPEHLLQLGANANHNIIATNTNTTITNNHSIGLHIEPMQIYSSHNTTTNATNMNNRPQSAPSKGPGKK